MSERLDFCTTAQEDDIADLQEITATASWEYIMLEKPGPSIINTF